MRPRIRSVKPELWQDEKIVRLSHSARLLFVGLITLADDEGRFRARRSQLVGSIFPGDDDAPERVGEWVAELEEQGSVVFYADNGTPYGAFRHWQSHQKINRANPSKLPPPPDPKVVRANRVRKQGRSTERDGSAHEQFSESSRSNHSSPRRRAVPDPILSLIPDLSQRLAKRITENDQKADPQPDSQRWLDDMRLLVRDRGWSLEAVAEVERMIDWCQADAFWRSNILSPGKLRKQFTQLVLKASKPPTGANGRAVAGDWLDEIGAAQAAETRAA